VFSNWPWYLSSTRVMRLWSMYGRSSLLEKELDTVSALVEVRALVIADYAGSIFQFMILTHQFTNATFEVRSQSALT